MSFSSISWSFKIFFIILQMLIMYGNGCYTSIFSFGDSLSDTGNIIKLTSKRTNEYFHFLHPPYGETFFHQPTGRCSNGRLIIDFLAERLGLPLVRPFLHNNEIDSDIDSVVGPGQGVNYVVVGSNALNSSFLETRGIVNPLTNASLGIQLAWFKQSLPSLCKNVSDCRNLIERSLILVGEIGVNDYHIPITDGKPLNEVEPIVPLVTDTIVSAVNELIEVGAKTLIVPGAFPLGCSSSWLTIRGSQNEEYDNTTGCLIKFNKFIEYHNQLLQTKLNHLQELYPNVIIIYADYYNAAMPIFRSPDKFGFTNGALRTCCGVGGLYNFNISSLCGDLSVPVCDDPNTLYERNVEERWRIAEQ